MKRAFRSSLFAALLAGVAFSAQAITLTFDGAGTLQDLYADNYTGAGDTYTQAGYTLTVGAGQHFDSMDSSGLFFHNGSANTNVDNWARLTYSGGLFDLTSFDFLQGYSGEIRTNLGATIFSFAAGSNAVNLLGLTWVEFSPTGNGANDDNYLYLDNVAVNASVPEPESLALLGLGLAGAALARRRKQA